MQCRKFARKLRNGKSKLSDFEPLLLDRGFKEVGQSFYHQITIKIFSRLSLLPPPIFPPFFLRDKFPLKNPIICYVRYSESYSRDKDKDDENSEEGCYGINSNEESYDEDFEE